jgi:hypothetical protein
LLLLLITTILVLLLLRLLVVVVLVLLLLLITAVLLLLVITTVLLLLVVTTILLLLVVATVLLLLVVASVLLLLLRISAVLLLLSELRRLGSGVTVLEGRLSTGAAAISRAALADATEATAERVKEASTAHATKSTAADEAGEAHAWSELTSELTSLETVLKRLSTEGGRLEDRALRQLRGLRLLELKLKLLVFAILDLKLSILRSVVGLFATGHILDFLNFVIEFDVFDFDRLDVDLIINFRSGINRRAGAPARDVWLRRGLRRSFRSRLRRSFRSRLWRAHSS